MTAKSFKQMIKDGEIKRADAMKVRIEDIHEEIGFNLRREGEDLEQSISELAAFIIQGGQLPPLEVRPRAEGGVYVVDGHRRRRAYLKAEADGASVRDGNGELWISVVAFTGNDAERVARVITSQEGRKLSPLELAEGYKRLAAFNWTPEQIAQKVGKTRQHVDQMLTLANANTDVQQLVAAGSVAAATAVGVVREHGDNAGNVLSNELDKAKANGKNKVTQGTMKPWSPPAKASMALIEAVAKFIGDIPTRELMAVGDAKIPSVALRDLADALDDIQGLRSDAELRAKAKAEKAKHLELQEGVE